MEKNKPFSQRLLNTTTEVSPDDTLRSVTPTGESKARRGFASMDPALQQRIAAAGGKASHLSGRGHQWTAAEARDAGRKGGLISRRKPSKNVSDGS